MLTGIVSHMGDIIVAVILILVAGAVIWEMVKDKKSGKSSCGCGCEGCAGAGCCHPQAKPENK